MITDDIIGCLLNKVAKWSTKNRARIKYANPTITKLYTKTNHLKQKNRKKRDRSGS